MGFGTKKEELFMIAEKAVHYSGGRLRLAFNEEDGSEEFDGSAQHFLKLDGKRLGRDIEIYVFMGKDITGWQQTLAMLLEEVLFPIEKTLPLSYAKAGELLRKVGESVYPAEALQSWRELF